MKTEELLFYLLREEFGVINPTEQEVNELKESLKQEQMNDLFNLAKIHDVANLVGDALAKLNVLSLEDDLYKLFDKERMLAVYRLENQRYEYEQVKELFKAEGIKFIPLKGAVIRNYYPENVIRTSYDLDLLVDEKDFEKVKRLLIDRLRYKAPKTATFHDMGFESQAKVKVEIHFSLKEGLQQADAILMNAWDYAISENQTSEYRLTNEFILFYLTAHAAYHFLDGGCGIKPVMDLFVLQKNLEYNEQKLNEILEEGKLLRFFQTLINLKAYWFENQKASEDVLKTSNYLIDGGAYGSREKGVVMANVKKGSKTRYFFSRTFLSYRKLKRIYPILEKHKWLFPFYQVVRWFSFLFGSRSKTGRSELAVLTSVKKQDLVSARDLLECVGLVEN